MGTTSWQDHVVCTSDAKDFTTHVEVMYDCIFSDHHPVLVKADLNIQAECEQEHYKYLKRHINWDILSLNVVRLYKQYTNDGFSSITMPHGAKCTNPNCSCPSHANDIDLYYKRRRLYLCSAKDPVLQGSQSRRVYRRKGMIVNRVYVCL